MLGDHQFVQGKIADSIIELEQFRCMVLKTAWIIDEIEAGRIPGPRYLANGPEITVTGGLGDENALHLPHFKGTPLEQLFPGYIEPFVAALQASLTA